MDVKSVPNMTVVQAKLLVQPELVYGLHVGVPSRHDTFTSRTKQRLCRTNIPLGLAMHTWRCDFSTLAMPLAHSAVVIATIMCQHACCEALADV